MWVGARKSINKHLILHCLILDLVVSINMFIIVLHRYLFVYFNTGNIFLIYFYSRNTVSRSQTKFNGTINMFILYAKSTLPILKYAARQSKTCFHLIATNKEIEHLNTDYHHYNLYCYCQLKDYKSTRFTSMLNQLKYWRIDLLLIK